MQKCNKSNIIILALLYNYISNKKTFLKINDIEHFFNEINYELLIKECDLIEDKEDEDQNVYLYNDTNKTISFTNIGRIPYSLADIKTKYIDILPKEIIEASISSNVITTIKGKREYINTRVCLEPKYLLGCKTKKNQNLEKSLAPFVRPIFPSSYNTKGFYNVEKVIIDIDQVLLEHEKKLELN